MQYHLSIGDQKYEVEVGEIVGDSLTVQVNGAPYEVVIDNPEALNLTAPASQPAATPHPAAKIAVRHRAFFTEACCAGSHAAPPICGGRRRRCGAGANTGTDSGY